MLGKIGPLEILVMLFMIAIVIGIVMGIKATLNPSKKKTVVKSTLPINYCRSCKSSIKKGQAICISCKNEPSTGHNYCPQCGAETKQGQAICISCKGML